MLFLYYICLCLWDIVYLVANSCKDYYYLFETRQSLSKSTTRRKKFKYTLRKSRALHIVTIIFLKGLHKLRPQHSYTSIMYVQFSVIVWWPGALRFGRTYLYLCTQQPNCLPMCTASAPQRSPERRYCLKLLSIR